MQTAIQQLKHRSDLYLFKRKKGFILLLGQFELKEQALQSLNQLNLEQPAWIRSWRQVEGEYVQPMAINHVISM